MNLGEKMKLKGETYTKSNKCCGTSEFFLALLCCIFSPLAVFIWSGADKNLLINVICFICGFLPGVIHGWYVILSERMLKRLGYSFLACILPPLAIALKQGFHQTFLINCLLTLLGFLPGVIHALYIIWTYKSARILGV